MTNDQVISLVIADPTVIEKHTRIVGGVPQPPTPTALQALAQGELQNEINSLLNKPPIRAKVLERVASVSTSSTTAEGRGAILTLPTTVGSVLSVTTSDTQLPLTKIESREDFDYWYAERYKSTSAPSTPQAWVPWDPSATGAPQILLTPGVGSSTTVKIAYMRKINQPVSMSLLPDDVHYLVVTGVKNRMTGGAYDYSYQSEIQDVIARLKPMIGGVSPLRLGDTERAYNLHLSGLTATGETLWTDPDYARPY